MDLKLAKREVPSGKNAGENLSPHFLITFVLELGLHIKCEPVSIVFVPGFEVTFYRSFLTRLYRQHKFNAGWEKQLGLLQVA